MKTTSRINLLVTFSNPESLVVNEMTEFQNPVKY